MDPYRSVTQKGWTITGPFGSMRVLKELGGVPEIKDVCILGDLQAGPHQWDEARIEQQLCLLYSHAHDSQPLQGSVVCRQLCAAH